MPRKQTLRQSETYSPGSEAPDVIVDLVRFELTTSAAWKPRNTRRLDMVDFRQRMARQFKIIVEKHADGDLAYPLGMKGIVVGEGDSYEEALADVKSAIRFHIETFGDEVLPDDSPLIEAFIAEATISS